MESHHTFAHVPGSSAAMNRFAPVKMASMPMGTHPDQMAMGAPLFSGENHRAMMAGTATPMSAKLRPSTKRLNSKSSIFGANDPIRLPTAADRMANRPTFFGPNLSVSPPDGSASTSPVTVGTVMSQPPSAGPIPRSAMSSPMVGGTLNMLMAMATAASIPTSVTSQPLADDGFRASISPSFSRFPSVRPAASLRAAACQGL